MDSVLKYWFRIEAGLAIVCLFSVACLLFADVLAREFFGNGIFAAQKLSVYATAIGGVLGYTLVLHSGGHLRPTAIDKLTPAGWDSALNRIADLISSAICAFLGVISAQFVHSTYELGEVGMVLLNPLWPIQLIIPYTFFSASLRYFIYAVRQDLRPAERSALDSAGPGTGNEQEAGR